MGKWANTFTGISPGTLTELSKYALSKNALPISPASRADWEVVKQHAKANGITLPDELPESGMAYYGMWWMPTSPMPTTEPSFIVCGNGLRIRCL